MIVMATDKWSIVSRIQNRVKDIPTALGSEVIVQYVEDASNDMTNITGQTLDLTDIGSKWHGVLTNLGACYVLGYMLGVGVSYTAGRLSVDKQTELDGNAKQIEFFVSQVNNSIKMLGDSSIRFTKTEPIV